MTCFEAIFNSYTKEVPIIEKPVHDLHYTNFDISIFFDVSNVLRKFVEKIVMMSCYIKR